MSTTAISVHPGASPLLRRMRDGARHNLLATTGVLLVILFVLAALAHALVGLRSVLADYVHTRARLVAAELLVRGATVILTGASVLAVLKLFLGR